MIENAQTHKILRILCGHRGEVTTLAIDSVHGLLASKSLDKTIRIWDLATGQTVQILSIYRYDDSPMAFSQNGNAFAYVDAVTLHVKDIYSWDDYITAGFLPRVTGLQFIDDDKYLAIGKTAEGRSRICDLSTGKLNLRDTLLDTALMRGWRQGKEVMWHSMPVAGAGAEEKQVNATHTPGFIVQNGHAGPLTAIVPSDDNRYLFTVDAGGTVIVWDKNSGLILRKMKTGLTMFTRVKIALRNSKLIMAFGGGTSVITQTWNWRSGKKIRENLIPGQSSNWYTNDSYLFLLQFNPKGPVVTALYDFVHDSIVRVFPSLWETTLSPAGDRIAAFDFKTKGLYIIDFVTGKIIDSLPRLFYQDSVHYEKIKFSENGRYIGLGNDLGAEFELWDLRNHSLCYHQKEFLYDFALNEELGELAISSSAEPFDLYHSKMVIRNLSSGSLLKEPGNRVTRHPVWMLAYDRRNRLNLGESTGDVYSLNEQCELDFDYYPAGHHYLSEFKYDSAGHRLLIREDFIHVLDLGQLSCKRVVGNEFLAQKTVLDEAGKSIAFYVPPLKGIGIKDTGPVPAKQLIPTTDSVTRVLFWDSRRSLLAFESAGRQLIVQDIHSAREVRIALPDSVEVWSLIVSSDMSQVAFSGIGDALFLYRRDTLEKLDCGDFKGVAGKLAFSADDRYLIACGAGAPVVYPLAALDKPFLLGGTGMGVNAIIADPRQPDRLLTSSLDGWVRTFSMGSRKLVDAYKLPGPLIYMCRGDAPNVYFAGTGENSIYRFDVIRKRILNVVYSNDGACLISDTLGNYTTTSHTFRDFGFTIDNHCYSLDQFDARYNRPDKVLRSFSFIDGNTLEWYRKVVHRRMTEAGPSVSTPDRLMPQIAIESWRLDTVANRLCIHLSGSSQSPIKEIRVKVNGNPVYRPGGTGRGVNAIDRRVRQVAGRYKADIMVPLNTGLNRIQLSMVNKAGRESLKQILQIRYPRVNKPDIYFIGIGVSRYKYFETLRGVDNDVDTLIACLRSAAGTWFNEVKIDTFLNEAATAARVRNITPFLKRGKADDIVIVYYAGHGMLINDSSYYLASYDMDFRAPARRGISYDLLEHALDSIPERNKVIVVNACHSGEVDKDPAVFAKMRILFSDLRPGNGATVIAAAAGDNDALVPADQGLSNMGQALRMAFRGIPDKTSRVADANADGILQVSELIDFLELTVPELSHGRQLPTIRKQNMDADFRIW